LLNTIAHEWGFGFVKTDFVYAGGLPGIRQNPKMTRAQAFRKGMEAVREGIGEDTFLLGCGCPFGPAVGIVDAIRVGPDTAPNWTPFLWTTKWATPIIKSEKSIGSLRNNIRHTLNLSALHRKWWWNDPDCLMVRSDNTSLSRDEVQSTISLVGSNGNFIIHSDNLNKLTPDQVALFARTTPPLESDARPLDLLEQEMAETVVVHQEQAAGRWTNVALFNWSDEPADKLLDLRSLGIQPGTNLHVFDFWEEKVSTVDTGVLKLKQIPAHGCKLLRFAGADGSPCLVGDTLHTSQGAEFIHWQISGNQVSLASMDMGREVSEGLWFWLPGKPDKITANSRELPFTNLGLNIFHFKIAFSGQVSITISMENQL
jgi:alpha-galactosidase